MTFEMVCGSSGAGPSREEEELYIISEANEEKWQKIESELKPLLGKKIKHLLMGDDQSVFVFVDSDNQKIPFLAENDCCNSVWFNHISGLKSLIGNVVVDIEEKDWRDADISKDSLKREDPDIEEACIITISTNKGRFDIELRNSHNGYYGGRVIFFPEFNNEYQAEPLIKIEKDF